MTGRLSVSTTTASCTHRTELSSRSSDVFITSRSSTRQGRVQFPAITKRLSDARSSWRA